MSLEWERDCAAWLCTEPMEAIELLDMDTSFNDEQVVHNCHMVVERGPCAWLAPANRRSSSATRIINNPSVVAIGQLMLP